MLSRRSRMASHLSRAWLPTRTSTQQRLFKRGISKLPQSVYLTPPYPPQDLRQTLALACQAASLHQNVADEEPSTSSRRATLEKSMDALSSKEDSASEDVSNEPALPDRDSLESHPAERNYRGITYIRFPRVCSQLLRSCNKNTDSGICSSICRIETLRSTKTWGWWW